MAKRFPTLYARIPRRWRVPLFGDRERYGRVADPDDPMWQAWLREFSWIHEATQKRSIGKVVNDAGYRVLRRLDLEDKRVLEIGPGFLPHVPWWRGRPAHYTLVDVLAELLDRSGRRLSELGVPYEAHVVEPGAPLPFPDDHFDVVLSFYVLEHLHPITEAVDELLRVARPGGLLAGAIPTEGGLAWGLGRYLTSRRWLLRNTQIDPDKIICWGHPTFASEILATLESRARRRYLSFWPVRVPLLDPNLVVRFVYEVAERRRT